VKQPPVIKINWRDANTENGWQGKESASKLALMLCDSVGFLLEETDEFFKIAQSINDGEYGDVTVIPKNQIIKRRFLK